MPIDLTRTLVLCYDLGGKLKATTWHWLEKNVPDRKRRFAVRVRPYIVARNAAIRNIVLPRAKELDYVLSVDHDVTITEPGVRGFLALDADLASCRCTLPNLHAWDDPTAFHTPFWWARIDALAKIEPPWFMWRYSSDGCALTACDCSFLRDKAIAAGLVVRNGGWCGHSGGQTWQA